MALDEPKKNDEIFKIDGFEYVIDKNLLAKFKPISVDFNCTGFKITGGVDYGASYSNCGTYGSSYS